MVVMIKSVLREKSEGLNGPVFLREKKIENGKKKRAEAEAGKRGMKTK